MVKYKIHYPELNVTQYKTLIDHYIFEKYKFYNTFNKDLAKKYIAPYGEYFTDNSSLFLNGVKSGFVISHNKQFKVEMTLL